MRYRARFPGHGRIVEAVFRQCGLPFAAAGTRIRYFGDYELLERSRVAGWEWFTRPGRSASIAWWH